VDEWQAFMQLGDDFLVAYAQVSPRLVVRTFLIGHATELYLKAVLLKRGLSLPEVKSHRHDLKSLLSRCREADPKLPVEFEFRDTVLATLRDTRGARMNDRLSPDDAKHFSEYLDLYYAAYAQGDLKYLGTMVERGLDVLYVSYPSSGVKLMLDIFDPIRRYLGITADVGTVIRSLLEPPWPDWAPVKLLEEYDIRRRAQQAVSP